MVTINNRDPRPIYEQIRDNLRKLIVSGVIAPDEKLPSVRELAQQLAINPNTIQRAYRELEQDGYSYSVAGKGNFASTQSEVRLAHRQRLLRKLADTVAELEEVGVSRQEMRQFLQEGESNK